MAGLADVTDTDTGHRRRRRAGDHDRQDRLRRPRRRGLLPRWRAGLVHHLRRCTDVLLRDHQHRRHPPGRRHPRRHRPGHRRNRRHRPLRRPEPPRPRCHHRRLLRNQRHRRPPQHRDDDRRPRCAGRHRPRRTGRRVGRRHRRRRRGRSRHRDPDDRVPGPRCRDLVHGRRDPHHGRRAIPSPTATP